MSEFLNVSLFQTDTVWNDVDSNLKLLDLWIEKIPVQTDLVVLPEMFLTGFSMDVHNIAQTMEGKGVYWLKSVAQSRGLVIMGSLTIKEDDHFYNRMLIALPNGEIQWYNKRHLFRMGEEHKFFSPGVKSLVLDVLDWKVMPLVCYDLRFPVWSRNRALKYDILVYVANWPHARRDAFMTLLRARAIENQCYVIAVNRVGVDGQGISYSGGSVVVDPKGVMITTPSDTEGIINCSISFKELKEFRQKFPAYLDADDYEIK